MLPLYNELGSHHSLLRRTIDFFFPPVCKICNLKITESELKKINNIDIKNTVHQKNLIIKYRLISSYLEKRLFCEGCLNELINSEISKKVLCNLCGSIDQNCNCKYIIPKNFKVRLRSIYFYTDCVKKLIHSLKFKNSNDINTFITLKIISEFSNIFYSKDTSSKLSWDLILHIPSLEESIKQRGSYSSLLCCKLISDKLNKIPVISPLTINKKNLGRRTNLSISKRLKEKLPRYHFSEEDTKMICSARKILVFDDVVTTGGTVTGLIKSLRKHTTSEIDILTIGRSIKFKANFLKLLENNTMLDIN